MPAPKSIPLAARLRRVKLFLTDVDGVLPPRPEGTPENRSAFQRREQAAYGGVPKGRLNGHKSVPDFSRFFGTHPTRDEVRGIGKGNCPAPVFIPLTPFPLMFVLPSAVILSSPSRLCVNSHVAFNS